MHKSKLRHEPNNIQLNKNAGFSLIELLIAVIVLAIIIVPFSRSFIASSRMNGNSRRLQRATTVAQDIVEGLKAYSIDELQEQFGTFGVTNDNEFYVVDSRLIHGRMGALKDPHNSGEPDTPGVYYFAMEDFRIQNVEYDALIKLDASVYREGSPTLAHDNAFNTYNMARPGSVIKGRDGSYAQPMDYAGTVLGKIKSSFGLDTPGALVLPEGEEFSFKTFKNMGGKIDRTITLTIDYDHSDDVDGNTVTYCNANIKIDYECSYNGGSPVNIYLTSDDGTPDPCAHDITSGNFYLFYYPCYEAQNETIIINNNSGQKFQIFIVKQIEVKSELDSEGHQQQLLSDSQLKNAERFYNVAVDVHDAKGIDNTVIRTNLGMYLVNSTFKVDPTLPGTNVTRPAGELPTVEVEKEDADTKDQAKYMFNGVPSDDLNVFGLAGTRFRPTEGGNIYDSVTEVIFDIEVSIYRQGACNEGFPESMRMVVIEGSKNN